MQTRRIWRVKVFWGFFGAAFLFLSFFLTIISVQHREICHQLSLRSWEYTVWVVSLLCSMLMVVCFCDKAGPFSFPSFPPCVCFFSLFFILFVSGFGCHSTGPWSVDLVLMVWLYPILLWCYAVFLLLLSGYHIFTWWYGWPQLMRKYTTKDFSPSFFDQPVRSMIRINNFNPTALDPWDTILAEISCIRHFRGIQPSGLV